MVCNYRGIISASGHEQSISAKVNCGPLTFVWRMQRQYAYNEMGFDVISHILYCKYHSKAPFRRLIRR